MKAARQKAPLLARIAICALTALSAAPARAQGATSQAPAQPQIIKQVEAQAEAYQAAIPKIRLEVRQTERFFDRSGHLKKTLHSSFRYAFPVADAGAQPGAVLADGATLPLVFLPGSITHLSLRAETPANGPWVLHFKSTPCNPPDVHRRWMESNIVSQCVEGKAFLDPKSGAPTSIRMEMGGLPIGFRSMAYPLGVIVVELYNEATFHMVRTSPGAAPRLLPAKTHYVTYTTRGRTVIDQTFAFAPANRQAPASP